MRVAVRSFRRNASSALVSVKCRNDFARPSFGSSGEDGICLALDIEPSPKHVEATRAKLKRMVNRHVLTEDQPGVFTLTPKRT